MKFIKPNDGTAGSANRPGSSVHVRPDWLIEWIENQGKYVTLDCEHRIDLKDRNVVYTSKDKRVWCYHCGEIRIITKSISLFEFHFGYPQESIPDDPPF